MTIEDRLRHDIQQAANSIAVPPGAPERVRARARHRRLLRTTSALVAVAAAVAAFVATAGLFGGTPRSEVGVVGESPSATAPVTSTPPTTAVPTTAVPTTEPGAAGSWRVIVATPQGIVTVSDLVMTGRIDVGPLMIALDDSTGGYVVQIGQSASSILWMEQEGGDLQEVVPAEPGNTLRLHEVVRIDGEPTVVYTVRHSGDGPEQVTETVRLYELASGQDTEVASYGAYERSASRISYAEGRFVATFEAEGYTWFEVLTGDATGFSNPRSAAEAAEDFLVWVGHGVQAPDGASMAYLRGSPRSEEPFSFVIVDLVTGSEVAAIPLEGVRDRNVTRLDWNGETGVVSLTDGPAVVIDGGAVFGALPVSGVADLGG